MATTKRNLISLLTLFLGFSFVPSHGTEEYQPTEIRFSVYAPRPVKGLHFAVFDDEGQPVTSVPLEFRTGGRSQTYDYSGPSTLVFFEETESKADSEKRKVARKVRARVEIPGNLSNALFVFLGRPKAEKEKDDFRILAIDDSLRALPWGAVTVYNATSATLKGNLGADSRKMDEIRPGQNEAVPISPSGQVKLAYRFRDEFWQLVYSENLSCGRNERLVLLIMPPRSEGARQLRGGLIKDYQSSESSRELASNP